MSVESILPKDVQQTSDGSLVRADGRILHFSIERFIRDIVDDGGCFVCGAPDGSKVFNDEHVIPNWILKRFKIYDFKVRLPNLQETIHGNQKFRCCQECNTLMNETFEKSLKKVFDSGFAAVRELVATNNRHILNWLALIHLKHFLMDRLHKLEGGKKPGPALSSIYDWVGLHHLHCLARSFYTGAVWAPNVSGTLLLLPAAGDDFDYDDDPKSNSMYIRLGDAALFATFTDSGLAGLAAIKVIDAALRRGRMSRAQLREMLAHLVYFNHRISPHPGFATTFLNGQLAIVAGVSRHTFLEHEGPSRGQVLYQFLGEVLDSFRLPVAEHQRIAHEILTEQYKLFQPDWSVIRAKGLKRKRSIGVPTKKR